MKKSNEKQKVLVNSLIVTIATTIDKFLFFFISIFVARYLSVKHYGEYTAALGHAHFFAILASLGINKAMIRAVNLDASNDNAHFTNSMLIRSVLSIILYGLMVLSLIGTNYNSNTIHLLLVFGLVRFGNEYLNGFYSLYDAKEKFLTSSLFTSGFSVTFFLATVIIIYYKGSYFHFAYSRLFILIFFLLALCIYTIHSVKLRPDFSKIKIFIKNMVPFGLQTICYNFYHRANIILLAHIHSTDLTGIFQNGFMFFLTLTFIPDNFIRILVPYLYKVPFNKDKKKFQFAFDIFSKAFAIISLYIFLIFFLYSPEIIPLVFGAKYNDSIRILQILAFGIPFVFNIASIIIIALDQQKYNTRILLVAALVNIGANIVLISRYKAEGAAIAVVITYMLIFVLCNLFLRFRNYITLGRTFLHYIKLILVTAACCYIQSVYMQQTQWLVSAAIISALYCALVFALLIRKDDIRIIKEALGGR